MKEYYSKTINIIEQSLMSIDFKVMEKMVVECERALKNNKKIIVSGLGKNVPICDKFVGTMLSLGFDAAFLHTNSAIHGDLGVVKEGDVVILLTKSGETSESIYLANILLKKNIQLWLITFNKVSTLIEKIPNHIVIALQEEGDPWNIMPNNSTTLNLIILQSIAMELIRRLEVTLNDFKINHPGGHIGDILKND